MRTASTKTLMRPRPASRSDRTIWERMWRQKALLLMTVPGLLVLLIFNYVPMYGVTIAFRDYSPRAGLLNSPWVGLTYFISFFKSPLAWPILKNTFLLGIYTLFWSFPAPILLALLFNELRGKRFKKTVQTVSFFPYFISVVVVCGMVKEFCSRDGMINQLTGLFGAEPISYLLDPKYFRTIFIASGIWQTVGFNTIIYLAALSGVDTELLDAASIDGANRFHKIRYINWPAIAPTTTILLIFAIGGIMGNDFTKVLLLYSPKVYPVADVIGTYTFREGIQGQRYEYSAAIGLLMSAIGFVLLVLSNALSRKISETSLW